MSTTLDLILRDGEAMIRSEDGEFRSIQCDIGVLNGRIDCIGDLKNASARSVRSISGLTAFPGFIDSQVHFREPGLSHKEDFPSASGAAVIGGVTSVFDMPNTKPALLTKEDLDHKFAVAKGRFWCDYAFYLGANSENFKNILEYEEQDGVCGVKVFLGPSTGHLVLNQEEAIRYLVQNCKRTIAFHCEDEGRLLEREHLVKGPNVHVSAHAEWRDEKSGLLASQFIAKIAQDLKRPVHILHVTTKSEMEFLRTQKNFVSVEVLPQHLTLSAPDCYERLGTFAQMNPPIRTAEHQSALWEGILNGTVDVMGSDHAPHTKEEKLKPYPQSPSGMPGVQTIVPLMIHHALSGKLSLSRVAQLLCSNPAKRFKIKDKGLLQAGMCADITLVDLKGKTEVTNDWIHSKCKWTPYDGMTLQGSVISTYIRGHLVFNENELLGSPIGKPLKFN